MEYNRKELLGVVGVDSGGLVVMDPGYTRLRVSSEPRVKFWGRDADALAKMIELDYTDILHKNEYSGCWSIPGGTEDDLAKIDEVKRRYHLLVMTHYESGDDFGDHCFHARMNTDQGGSIPYPLGHDGMAVSFCSGLGDGAYEVWAYYVDVEDWGERIAKVEIILISDEDLEEVTDNEVQT